MKKLILLFAVFSATFVTGQNIPCYVPTNGLIGWWPFNGNANDESGNNHDGTVYNSPSLTADRFGNSNAAYNFDWSGVTGSSSWQKIELPTITTSNNFTINIWTRPSDYCWPGNIIKSAMLIGGSAACTNTSGGLRFALSGNSGSIGTTIGSLTSDTGVVDLNVWQMATLVVTNDSSFIYMNSVLVASTSLSQSTTINSCLSVGLHHQGNGHWYFFDGDLDDIGIWNRQLTDAEIHDLFMSNVFPDTIQSQPTSNTFQTVPGSAHFTTAHSGTSATFQWQQNTGTGWTNLSDFGIYSGTTTDSLVLTGITTSLNGYGYRCIIDACNMDTTDVAFLTVEDNVGIEESAAALTISPNPTSGLIYVDIKANYSVYSMTGQKVAEGKTEGQIDISNLPTGSYQLILSTEEGTTTHTIQKI